MAGLPLLLLCCCCDTLSLSLSPFMKIRTGYFTSTVITYLPFQMTKNHRTRVSSVRIPEEAWFSLFCTREIIITAYGWERRKKERERKKKRFGWKYQSWRTPFGLRLRLFSGDTGFFCHRHLCR